MDSTLEKTVKTMMNRYKFQKFPIKTVEDYYCLNVIVFDIYTECIGPVCPGDILTIMGYTEDEKKEIDKIGYDSLMI